MPDLSGNNYSQTDSANSNAAPNGMPEGMPPSGVNDAWRAGMGALKRFWDRMNGTATLGGGTTAYTLSYSVNPASYVTGETFRVICNASCTGDSTLNINGLGAKHIFKPSSSGPVVLASGDLQAGEMYVFSFDAALNSSAGGFHVSGVASQAGVTSLADGTNGGMTVSASTGAVTISQNVADLSAATPTQASTLAFEAGSGTKKATLAGAANSYINVAAATKAQMQTGTDNTTVATPARVNDHDGTAKAWIVFDGTATTPITPTASFGISGNVTKNGTGDYSMTFATAWADATKFIMTGSYQNTANGANVPMIFDTADGGTDPTTTVVRVATRAGGALTDFKRVMLVFYGRQ